MVAVAMGLVADVCIVADRGRGSTHMRERGDCLILPHLSELTRDGKGGDAQLRLQARTHRGVVIATGSPYDLAGTEVGGHGEDHGVRCG